MCVCVYVCMCVCVCVCVCACACVCVYTALPEVGESNDCIRLRKYVLEKDIVSSVIGGDGDVEVAGALQLLVYEA